VRFGGNSAALFALWKAEGEGFRRGRLAVYLAFLDIRETIEASCAKARA
jgi:hypothetical protein